MRGPSVHRGTLRVLAGPLAVAFVGACADSTSLSDVRYPVDPPPAYRDFWTQTEGCALGRTRDFDGVRWFWTSEFPGAYETVGQWNERREITIHWSFRYHRGVVMHEILHDLLDGDGAHADPAWKSCGVPLGS